MVSKQNISGRYNEFLYGLGLSETVSTMFSQSIRQYALSSSPESILPNLFQLMGLENDSQINKYCDSRASFQKKLAFEKQLISWNTNRQVSEQIVSMTVSLYQQWYVAGQKPD